MDNLINNTAIILGLSVEEMMHQIKVLHIAADRVVGNIDMLSGIGGYNFNFGYYRKDVNGENHWAYTKGLDWSYGEKLDYYVKHFLVGKMNVNIHLAKAYLHCSWWDGRFVHPNYKDVLTEVHYQ